MNPRHLSTSAYLGAALLSVFAVMALFGPYLAPHSPTSQNLDLVLASPSGAHWLGTDQNGVDVLSMLLHGARVALYISAAVVLLSASIGTALGVVSGYYGGWVDELIMRIVDVLLAFPGILLNIAVVAAVPSPSIGVLIFALVFNGWVGYARIARGQVLSLRELEYVSAARSVGASNARIMFRHILPNLMSPILVKMTFGFGVIISVEASLSFLGLGPQIDYTWGKLLDQGTTFVWVTQRMALIPGLAIMVVVLGSNLLGDGLRDRFDPKRLD